MGISTRPEGGDCKWNRECTFDVTLEYRGERLLTIPFWVLRSKLLNTVYYEKGLKFGKAKTNFNKRLALSFFIVQRSPRLMCILGPEKNLVGGILVSVVCNK